jgi:ABC-type transporter Mla subunit MlaD
MSTLFLSQVDPVKITNALADKSDRWFIIFLGVIILISFGLAMRWLVTQFSKASDKYDASITQHAAALTNLCGTHSAALQKICNDQNQTAKDLAVTIANNTCALEEGTEERRKTRDLLDKIQIATFRLPGSGSGLPSPG